MKHRATKQRSVSRINAIIEPAGLFNILPDFSCASAGIWLEKAFLEGAASDGRVLPDEKLLKKGMDGLPSVC